MCQPIPGEAQEKIVYSPFGEVLSETGWRPAIYVTPAVTTITRLGCITIVARYYDPVVGRFITEDPLGFLAGVNFYAYVNNNPVKFNDPAGLNGVKVLDELAEGGVKLILKVKQGWNSSQIEEAIVKTKHLQAQADLVKTTPHRGSSASQSWKGAGNSTSPGKDVDHLVDLQLGGPDDVANMGLLDYSVNRSFGSQVFHGLKGYPVGTSVTSVSLLSVSGSVLADPAYGEARPWSPWDADQLGRLGTNLTAGGPKIVEAGRSIFR